MKIEIHSELFRIVLAVSRLIIIILLYYLSYFYRFATILHPCIFAQHDTKTGSNKTDNNGVKPQFTRCHGTQLFQLPVCIIQGPLLAAVGLVMKAA